MDWLVIILAAAVMLALAAVMAVVLIRAHRRWHVAEDPVVARVHVALAGLDCGACGYPTCEQYAQSIVGGDEPVNKCRPGGPAVAEAVAEIMGVEAPELGAAYAVVHCGATADQRADRADYRGEPTCAAADTIGAVQGCAYGCVGLGDCQAACPFDAIALAGGLPDVDYDRCTACGACVSACPRRIISIEAFKADRMLVVACNNRDPGPATRKVCSTGCIACGRCVAECELFEIRKNLSRLNVDDYDSTARAEQLQAASEKCPTGCLPFRGRMTPP